MVENSGIIYLKIEDTAKEYPDQRLSSTSGRQICRFCQENCDEFIDLFEDKNGTEVMLFLSRICDLTIDFIESWPRSACLVCVEKISSFREFCETIRENENTLRRSFDNADEVDDVKEEEEALLEELPVDLKAEQKPPDGDKEEEEEELQERHDDQLISEFFPLSCDLCQETFRRVSELRLHFRRQHNRRWYIVCCQVKHRQKGGIMEHLMYHTNPNKFKCPHCRRQFMTQSALTNHIENRHNPAKRILECFFCHKIFAIKAILKFHIRKQHMQRPGTAKSKVASAPRKEDKPMRCMCEVCGQIFDQTKSLQRHAKRHAPAQTVEQLQEGSMMQPMLRRFKCTQCGCSYKKRQTLKAHEKKHNAYGTYRCEHCGKVSPTPTALYKHIKDSHILQRDFVCHICHKGFKRKIVLKEHVAIHTGEYLYSCDFCPKQFRAGANKSLHMRREHPELRATASRVPKEAQ